MVAFSTVLKAFDLFATDTSFFISDGKRSGPQRWQKSFQSQCGAVVSITVQCLVFAYLCNLIVRMYSLDDDSYQASVQVNPFDETTLPEMYLGAMNLFFSIDIRATGNDEFLRNGIDILRDTNSGIKNED
jgi:hypothetical protein